MLSRLGLNNANWSCGVVALVTIVAAVSCTRGGNDSLNSRPGDNPQPADKKTTSDAQGGQDAGGGDLFTADEQTVVDAISDATVLLLSVTSEFWNDPFTGKQNFGQIIPANVQFIMERGFADSMLHVIKGNVHDGHYSYPNIHFKKNGGCVGPDGIEHDGSANTSTGNASICLSLAKFTSIPKDYLAEELAVLLAHEISHIDGKDEASAQAVQTWVSSYLKVRVELAKFRIFVGGKFQRSLYAYNIQPSPELGKQLFSDAAEVDRATKILRYKLRDFKIKWPSANEPEYWMRRTGKLSSKDLQAEFDTFINQFGFAVPRELNL